MEDLNKLEILELRERFATSLKEITNLMNNYGMQDDMETILLLDSLTSGKYQADMLLLYYEIIHNETLYTNDDINRLISFFENLEIYKKCSKLQKYLI